MQNGACYSVLCVVGELVGCCMVKEGSLKGSTRLASFLAGEKLKFLPWYKFYVILRTHRNPVL